MEEPTIAAWLKHMEHLGYDLLPQLHPRCPGHQGLLVAIRRTPTLAHFDPEALRLPVVDTQGLVTVTTFHLEPTLRLPISVAVGRILVSDRVNKRLGFFSFGGTLEGVAVPHMTLYVVRSPAPLLALSPGFRPTVADQLAAEAEALIARNRVRWGVNDMLFRQRLAQTAPMELYVGVIHSLLTQYARTPALRHSFPALYATLQAEKEWLMREGRWPAQPTPVDQLLAPD